MGINMKDNKGLFWAIVISFAVVFFLVIVLLGDTLGFPDSKCGIWISVCVCGILCAIANQSKKE